MQPGCLLSDVDRETQLYGLATPLGFISEVGVAGLTLGGGLGYLTRRFGWTVDNLLEVEIVTADGAIRRAGDGTRTRTSSGRSAGAGANLGVVTSFTFRLHEVGPTVYGGLIAWPFERAAEIQEAYRSLTAEAPRELAVWMNLLRAPAAPFVPEAWHGELVCVDGRLLTAASSTARTRPWRRSARWATPSSTCSPSSRTRELQSLLDATEPKGDHYYWKNGFVGELERRACSRPCASWRPSARSRGAARHPAPGRGAQRARGRRRRRGQPGRRYVLGVIGMWEPGEARGRGVPATGCARPGSGCAPFSTGGNYVNFQTADEGEDRIRATYGANFERVAEVKRRYDPGNLFRSNRNIRP